MSRLSSCWDQTPYYLRRGPAFTSDELHALAPAKTLTILSGHTGSHHAEQLQAIDHGHHNLRFERGIIFDFEHSLGRSRLAYSNADGTVRWQELPLDWTPQNR